MRSASSIVRTARSDMRLLSGERDGVIGVDDVVRALLEERSGYVARGMADRVAQVDAELERNGYVEASRARQRAAAGDVDGRSREPRGRRSRRAAES